MIHRKGCITIALMQINFIQRKQISETEM